MRQVGVRRQALFGQKKEPNHWDSARRKIWRQPTLAESIKPLPSARLCLTAVFGMGTGRTTALWPPKIVTGSERPSRVSKAHPRWHTQPEIRKSNGISATRHASLRPFSENRTQEKPGITFASQNRPHFSEKNEKRSSRTTD